jgi:uncharacterized protein (DUF2141 family)
MHPVAAVRSAAALAALALSVPSCLLAADIVVNVTGIITPLGQVGCSLFVDPKGFPMDPSAAATLWRPADPKGTNCRFPGVAAGTYAVSVVHDLNGNARVDTNLFGIPTEAWGVSNNRRPTLRAPRFEEAAFQVDGEAKQIVLDVMVAK